MPTYKAPVESVLFLLKDVLGYQRHSNLAGFADAPLDTVETYPERVDNDSIEAPLDPDRAREILDEALDALGAAHHRPFSRG